MAHPSPGRRGRRPSLLAHGRALPAGVRHGGAVALAGGMALLPAAGLPVVPEGQPFLLVLAILAAALLFGRSGALTAALAATAAGAALLLPSAGAAGADAARAGLSLVAFLVVGLGLAAAVEAMRRVHALMELADARRWAAAPVRAEARRGCRR